MGLITFFLLGAFSLLYISKSIPNKPAFVDKAVTAIADNIDKLAMIGVIYGLIAAFLTPLTNMGVIDMLVRLLANLMIVILALPYTFDKIVAKYQEHLNGPIVEEFSILVKRIVRQEKLFGIIGTSLTVLLFAVIFR
jgi:hypothetical protein